MKCKHFFITHNQQTPRGCRAYQIQAKELPSSIVKQANRGAECIGFTPKAETKKKKDLNDSKYW